jgi:hypothetical protein
MDFLLHVSAISYDLFPLPLVVIQLLFSDGFSVTCVCHLFLNFLKYSLIYGTHAVVNDVKIFISGDIF